METSRLEIHYCGKIKLLLLPFLADSSSQQVPRILEWKPTARVHDVHGGVCAFVQLGVCSQIASSKQDSCTMGAGSNCPSPHRTHVSLGWATAHCLDTASSLGLPIPHPVVLYWLSCGNIHNCHLVLFFRLVFALNLWHKQDS